MLWGDHRGELIGLRAYILEVLILAVHSRGLPNSDSADYTLGVCTLRSLPFWDNRFGLPNLDRTHYILGVYILGVHILGVHV